MADCKATVILGNTKMPICNKCIKADVCEIAKEFKKYPVTGMFIESCEHFKDRSKFNGLPCKVGDTVYYLKTLMDGKGTIVIDKDVVKQISINSHGVFLVISYCHCLNVAEFGKTVFLTKEEAEKALADIS